MPTSSITNIISNNNKNNHCYHNHNNHNVSCHITSLIYPLTKRDNNTMYAVR